MKLFSVVSLLLLLVLSSVSAQQSIKGIVTTSDGQPAVYVNIVIKGTQQGATSDEKGAFEIKHVGAGDCTLVLSSVGMQSVERHITVQASEVANVFVTLQEKATQLSALVVNGERGLNERQVSIGKSPIKAFDLPQSVITIDAKVLEEQQTQKISDVLKNVSGVYTMGTTGGTQEEIAGRGFAFGSNNTFKNGVRFNNSVMPDLSSLESVEVLKGSNAILFGNVAAGGVLNLVTKKPKFEHGGQISFRMGSFNSYKPSIDIYGPIDNSETVAYRINASYENAESFRDEVSAERIYFNPSFLVNLGENTNIVVEGDYLHDKRTPDYGVGAINYEVIDGPRSRFLGASWSTFEVFQKSLTVTVNQKLGEKWDLRIIGGAQGFASDLYSTSRPTTIKEDGTWARNLQRSSTNETYLLGQADLTGEFKTGSLKHTLLIGADIDQYQTNNTGYKIFAAPGSPEKASTAYDTINVFNLAELPQRTDIPRVEGSTLTKAPVNRVGFYLQDFITLSDKLKVLAGIRYSYMETGSKAFTYDADGTAVVNDTQTPKRYDDAFTPRAGVVYQPLKTTSIFASYANSFAMNSGRDVNFEALPPSMMDQYEVGVKNDFLDGLISANITFYHIVNSNQSQSVFPAPESPLNPTAQELAGEVTSKGVEVDVMTRPIKGFSFIAGYSHNDTRYTKSNVYEVGSRLRYNPVHTANFSAHYKVSSNSVFKGVEAGLGLFYVADMVAGRLTRLTVPNDVYKPIPLPSFLQVDVSIGYTFNRASLRVRMTNLTNALGYYAHDDNSINPIAPRQFVSTLAYSF